MLLDALLAFGLLMSTATQLRPAGALVGPGEVGLILWVAVQVGREVARRGPTTLTPAFSRMLLFWAALALALSLGELVGAAIEEVRDWSSFAHNTMAYLLVAAVACMSVLGTDALPRLRRVAWFLVGLGAAALAVQVAAAWEFVALPMIEPWFYDRFRGWSENPNQLGLLCIVLSFLACHLAAITSDFRLRLFAVTFAVPPIFAGFLSRSDAFRVSFSVGAVMLLGLQLLAWPGRAVRFRFLLACMAIVCLPLAVVSIAVSAVEFSISEWATSMIEGDGDQGDVRFDLWRKAIDLGLASELLGLGPGTHLEVPNLRTTGERLEAHNTPLDLFTQGGVIAVSAFLWLMASPLLKVWQRRSSTLTSMLASIGVFTMFHFVVRHPIFWYAVALTLVAGLEPRHGSATPRWD